MIKHAAEMKRVERFAKRLGGKLIVLDSIDEFNAIFLEDERSKRSPFSMSPASHGHGINWEAKRVYVVGKIADPGATIHELGHLFLDLSFEKVDRSDEFSWLGWEICAARKCDCYRTWDLQNASYGIYDDKDGSEAIWADVNEWGCLTLRQKRALAADRVVEAKRLGFVGKYNVPLSLR